MSFMAMFPGLVYGQRRKAIMTVDKQQMQAGRFIQGLEEMGITVVDRIWVYAAILLNALSIL